MLLLLVRVSGRIFQRLKQVLGMYSERSYLQSCMVQLISIVGYTPNPKPCPNPNVQALHRLASPKALLHGLNLDLK